MFDLDTASDTEGRNSSFFLTLKGVTIISTAIIFFGVIISSMTEPVLIATAKQPKFVWLTTYFFRSQDALWLVGVAILLAIVAIARPKLHRSFIDLDDRSRRNMAVTLLALFVLICGVVGTHLVFHDYHLSRDEILADFDATIFRSGHLIASIAPEHRPLASALAPAFMVPIDRVDGFVSAYLPVNAALRAVGGFVDPASTNPLLAAFAVIAVFAVARRLWPSDAAPALVAAAITATSSQLLVGSMTSYAMTAHLALDMLWLWLFVRDDEAGHAAAIIVGALAIGLHQAIFHPLFAAPFILRLWRSKRRTMATAYIVSYAIVLLFWISYWQLLALWGGVSMDASDEVGFVYFIARVVALLTSFQWSGADLMAKNILRFVIWQNPVLLPLVLLSYKQIRDRSGIAWELAAGICLTLIAMFVVLPYQGHGWGYRYMHGLLGNFSLLAAYGWIDLSTRTSGRAKPEAGAMLAIGCAIGAIILLPVHVIQAERFVQPYARAAEVISRTDADFVIVDKSGLLFVEDLVRNDPFLGNRPKILDLTYLADEQIHLICAKSKVALFESADATSLGISRHDEATKVDDDVRKKKRKLMADLGCGAEISPRMSVGGARWL
ncbi:hypothetical protein EDE12_1252 [Methylosinus sp. sav-2]|uniref:hypothetical protein n=1 Tax=Methylosinus sp. sav-2 TaxID=2485168 RepID=UPI001064B730|nr:hypothetical protein [Methylosinus sp. sav-2]TDX59883.1 hypothetical protein EDE12_1252 [Methylosinus sp. sav-2]